MTRENQEFHCIHGAPSVPHLPRLEVLFESSGQTELQKALSAMCRAADNGVPPLASVCASEACQGGP